MSGEELFYICLYLSAPTGYYFEPRHLEKYVGGIKKQIGLSYIFR